MTCSSHAVPGKNIWLFSLLVRPFGFDGISFFFLFLFSPPQNCQDIQWTLAKASDPEPQLPEGSEWSLHQQEPGQPGPCRAANIPQVPLPQRELHESHEHHQPGGCTWGSLESRCHAALSPAIGEAGFCFKWCSPTLSWNRLLKDLVLSTSNQNFLNASKEVHMLSEILKQN